MLTAVSIVLLAAGMAAIIRGNRDEFLSIDTTVTARGALALVIILHHLAVQANETNSMFYNEGGGHNAFSFPFRVWSVVLDSENEKREGILDQTHKKLASSVWDRVHLL